MQPTHAGLVLKRTDGQSLTLKTSDGPIVVTVIRVQNHSGSAGQMRLHIAAPASVDIYRTEAMPQANPEGVPA